MTCRITLVELPPTSFGKVNGEKIIDVYAGFRLPPRACPLLHAILLKQGYDDVKTIDPTYSLVSGKLTDEDLKRIYSSKYLFVSAITRTINQTKELAMQYKKENTSGTVIVGGTHATFLPEECLEWADVVVRNEGDKTIVELINNLEKDNSLEGIKGISYKKDGKIVHEEARESLTEEELSDLPLPFLEEHIKKGANVLTISTSRGCPFSCNFCTVTIVYGSKYRRKSNEAIICELQAIQQEPQKTVFFVDDNFAGKPVATKELLRQMIALGFNKKKYLAQLSVHAAFDPELLGLLKEAGVHTVFIGIESINNDTLKALNKKSTAEKNKQAIQLFRQAGIWVHAMMMIGGDGDTHETINQTVVWAKENCDSVQFFTPIPLPGTKFSEDMKKQERIISKDYYLYDAQHVLIKPKNFTPEELQKTIMEMYKTFYSFSLFSVGKSVHPFHKIAIDSYARGLIKSLLSNPQMKEHLNLLKTC